MPHSVYTRDLGRFSSLRKATVQSLTQALLRHERIETTLARAKETQRLAERLVTLGKEGSIAARRRAARILNNDRDLVRRLFLEVAPRFAKRQGGYTRIMHGGFRPGDGASMAVIEFVELSEKLIEKEKTGKKERKPAAQKPERKEQAPKSVPEPKQEIKPEPEKGEEKQKETEKKPKGFIEGLRNFFKGRPGQ